MPRTRVYMDLNGNQICLEHLDAAERKLLDRIRRHARTHPDWDRFDNYWTREVRKFYDARGVPRTSVRKGAVFRVALDLSGRIAVAAGLARVGDYRDELEELIREKYSSKRAFCQATGLAEDMLCHVLAGRKDLSLEALTRALGKIGYRLRILQTPKRQSATRVQKRTG